MNTTSYLKRPLKSLNTKLTDIFNCMRISQRQKLVGSASIVGNIIINDYDLNELIIKNGKSNLYILKGLYKLFLETFNKIYNNPTAWISDFKCGEYNNEPIRWSYENIQLGYKIMDDETKILFINCLTQVDTICKLDIVIYMNGYFNEISEIYFIKVNGVSNFNADYSNTKTIVKELHDDMLNLLNEKNIFKSLKREYRILQITNKNYLRQKKLLDLFNGVIGLAYYTITQLKILKLMMEQSFRKCPYLIIYEVQQNIKNSIGSFMLYNYAFNQLDLSPSKLSIKNIDVIITYLNNWINMKLYEYKF